VIHAVHSNDLRDMGGLARKMPLTTLTFVIGALSLAGLPGLAGFFSKDLILEAVGEHGLSLWLVLLLVSAFLTAFYMGRLLLRVFFAPATEKSSHAHESGGFLLLPLVLLAVPALATGYFGGMFGQLYGTAYHFHLGSVGILAAGLGVLGFCCRALQLFLPRLIRSPCLGALGAAELRLARTAGASIAAARLTGIIISLAGVLASWT
jgi:NADH-quinone oxidoreductase subunit L